MVPPVRRGPQDEATTGRTTAFTAAATRCSAVTSPPGGQAQDHALRACGDQEHLKLAERLLVLPSVPLVDVET
jgi:hypothetical protein